jgi:hypothetical protein
LGITYIKRAGQNMASHLSHKPKEATRTAPKLPLQKHDTPQKEKLNTTNLKMAKSKKKQTS